MSGTAGDYNPTTNGDGSANGGSAATNGGQSTAAGGVVYPYDDLENKDYSYDENYIKLVNNGICPIMAAELVEMFNAGIMSFDSLDERTVDFIKNIQPEHGRFVLNQFRKSNLMGISNPSSYLGSLIKNYKERVKLLGVQVAQSTPVIYAPSAEKLLPILQNKGYSLEVTIGQRKYGGPPPGFEGDAPSGGCELYIGRIPKDVYEDELVPILEKFGKLYDFRLMMDPVSGTNKGYAFATYMTKEEATSASKNLEDYEVKPGKKLRCNVSIANTRLFVGNIPKAKSKEEILKEFSENAEFEGIRDIIIYADPQDPIGKKNCGYCFVDFHDHKSASTAKRRIVDGHVKPWNLSVVCNWAEPQYEPDESVMQTVRTVFVKNLRDAATEDVVRKAFGVFGEVYKVRRVKDYAFVYFSERDCALQAIEKMHGQDFHGSKIDCSLAKPQSEQRKKVVQSRAMTKMGPYGSPMGGGGDPYYQNYQGYYGGYGYDTPSYGPNSGYDYGYGTGGIQYPMHGGTGASTGYSGGVSRGGLMGVGGSMPYGTRGGGTAGAPPQRPAMQPRMPSMRARASPAMAAQFRMTRGGGVGGGQSVGMSPMGGAYMGMTPRGGRGGVPMKRPGEMSYGMGPKRMRW